MVTLTKEEAFDAIGFLQDYIEEAYKPSEIEYDPEVKAWVEKYTRIAEELKLVIEEYFS